MIPVLVCVLLAGVVGVSAAVITWTLTRTPAPRSTCWACGRIIPSGTDGTAAHMLTYHDGALGPEDHPHWNR